MSRQDVIQRAVTGGATRRGFGNRVQFTVLVEYTLSQADIEVVQRGHNQALALTRTTTLFHRFE